MDFFTKEDLLEVRKWHNVEYDSESDEHQQVRHFLIDYPETKTKYWSKQVADRLGWVQKTIRNPRKRGRNTSIFRGYTWGRIFRQDQLTNEVFYTVGINGDSTKDNSPFLHIKIDRQFQRSSDLTDQQQKKLKRLLVKDNGEYRYQDKIYLDVLDKLDWDELIDRTTSFIKDHQAVYNNVLSSIADEQKKYFTRICWNVNGWKNPTGREGKSDSDQSFEGITGFGMEEWLFAEMLQLDGYQYGFLQGINQNSPPLETFAADLYTVQDTGKGKVIYWVCSIENIQILSEEEAFRIQQETGFEKVIQQHLSKLPSPEQLEEDIASFVGDQLLNIRFRFSDVKYPITEDLLEIDLDLSSYKRYRLFKGSLFDQVSESKPEDSSTGFDELGSASGSRSRSRTSFGRRSPGSYEIKHVHDEISRGVESFLKGIMKSGEKVNYEVPLGSFKAIDLVYEKASEINYYEIKTHPKLIFCIREGIGQLLEYAYYNRPEHDKELDLILVSPHKPTEMLKRYIEKLRAKSEFNIFYQQFDTNAGILMEKI